MLYGYQYDDLQGTASSALKFLDDYFNNGDGITHVASPRPVSYYVWGGGGATYYSAANDRGYQSETLFSDAGFEGISVGSGGTSLAPSGPSWTFSGNAGVYADPTMLSTMLSASSRATQGNLTTSTAGASYLGYKFTVGSKDIGVYELGRWVAPGNTGSHTVTIVRASDKAQMAKGTITATSSAVGGVFVRNPGTAGRPGREYH